MSYVVTIIIILNELFVSTNQKAAIAMNSEIDSMFVILEIWQFVGMAVYIFLAVCFFTFLGLFLGNRTAEIVVTVLFSLVVIYDI